MIDLDVLKVSPSRLIFHDGLDEALNVLLPDNEHIPLPRHVTHICQPRAC